MSPLIAFLERARRLVERRRALVWAIRGAAVSAVGALLVLLAARRWPTSSTLWPWLAAPAALGAAVAVIGWLAARPSLGQVARLADRSLGARERLATALELAEGEDTEDHVLVGRQRADTEAWIATADPGAVAKRRVPRPTVAIGSTAALLALVLAVLPNSAQGRAQAGQQAEAAREAVADRIAAEVKEASKAAPGEDGARRQALLSELRRVEEALRDAKSTKGAVAELSRTQDKLRQLAGPTNADRRSAAGAGAALAEAAPAAAAGEALAEVGDPAGQELENLAAALPGLKPEEEAALSKAVAQAAKAATDPAAADGLRQAAEQLASGQTAAAQQSLTAAARRQEEQRADRAAAALSNLAKAVPALDAAQQASLAQALQQAAVAAEADPGLADSIRRAADALQVHRPEAASAALEAAGRRAQQLGPESALDATVASTANQLASMKDGLLAAQQPVAGPGQGQAAPVPGQGPTQGQEQGAEPGKGKGDGKGKGQGPDLGGSPSKGGIVSSGSGGAGPDGKGPNGSGQGQGKSSGGIPGEGQGSGQGQSAGGGAQRGGGGEPGGAAGGLQGPPGLPNEQVYVPGISGPGSTQALPGEGGGRGADTAPVPYESVYGEYRAEALSQANRELIPDRVQELLRQYFEETPP